MGAEEGLGISSKLIIAVMIVGILFAIYGVSTVFSNKGLSQAAHLSKNFDDVEKQKYAGMTLTGDLVVQVIQDFWEDPTCEVVVCTLDGVNAVYNKESTDGTYKVPFDEVLTGMPTTDSKGRSFPTDISIKDTSKLVATSFVNEDAKTTTNGVTYNVTDVANYNITDGNPAGPAIIVDAAQLVQNPDGIHVVLGAKSGYNNASTLGSGGYISTSSSFEGSIQKDANGKIRRITFVQKG